QLGGDPAQRVFVATAQAYDDEMRERIAAHTQERGGEFRTLEAPLQLTAALAAIPRADVVVIDCVTFWLSNLLVGGARVETLLSETDALVAELSRRRFHTVLVTNEVGMGVVPDNVLGRQFRDASGGAHQRLAAVADEIYFGMLGTLLRLRPEPLTLLAPEGRSRS
ncbi:MAG TPA: bifunctional adenosylcobinamide kinase/adenosylcobinamide-phosphate guanylyltransferase, partial [Polyangiales bacterium]|nr:bifunctional adenosylcobinamide kinase/adenosylcobinamide-phosphate guanylyltransferase [Polyangiales bacterium]